MRNVELILWESLCIGLIIMAERMMAVITSSLLKDTNNFGIKNCYFRLKLPLNPMISIKNSLKKRKMFQLHLKATQVKLIRSYYKTSKDLP
jgi:hypothetical protein